MSEIADETGPNSRAVKDTFARMRAMVAEDRAREASEMGVTLPDDEDEREAAFARLRKAGEEDERRRFGGGEADASPSKAESQVVEDEDEPAPESCQLSGVEPLGMVRLLSGALIVDGEERDCIVFREPSFETVNAVLRGRMSQGEMIAEMAGLPNGFLKRLAFSDADRVTIVALALAPNLGGSRQWRG